MSTETPITRSLATGTKVATVFNKRMQAANAKFAGRMSELFEGAAKPESLAASLDPLGWASYAVDASQRALLFWDVARYEPDAAVDEGSLGVRAAVDDRRRHPGQPVPIDAAAGRGDSADPAHGERV